MPELDPIISCPTDATRSGKKEKDTVSEMHKVESRILEYNNSMQPW